MYLAARRARILPKEPGLGFCYDMLNRVSRSFAVVIQQLPEKLRDAVCVFYLVLRALDTVEDDMSIEESVKVPLLRSFHQKSRERGWTMDCGSGHYAILMKKYNLVTDVFLELDTDHQRIIEDICRRMGNGMADFITMEVKTVAEYDLYCHYVAGLVGVGLSELFASSGLEDKFFFKAEFLSNEMGLFLQKTNIIRDYLEDINEEPAPRMFWPKKIWGKYANNLDEFKSPANSKQAVACLNHMILDALRHSENSLEYMSKLKCPAIFRFCAIPQVMAAGTLTACLNNHCVFEGVVKMRRGETAKIWWNLETFADCCFLFRDYAREMASIVQGQAKGDPHQEELLDACLKMESAAERHLKKTHALPTPSPGLPQEFGTRVDLSSRLLMLLFSTIYFLYAYHMGNVRELMGLPVRGSVTAIDSINRVIAAVLLGYSVLVALTGRHLSS